MLIHSALSEIHKLVLPTFLHIALLYYDTEVVGYIDTLGTMSRQPIDRSRVERGTLKLENFNML